MAWHDPDGWLTYSFGPNIPAILLTLVVSLSLPVLIHWFLYRQRTPSHLPTFLVLGPSGAGKTALVTHFETGHAAATRPSQTPLTVAASLPADTPHASAKYRASADPTLSHRPRIRLLDTPGHPKLRAHALAHLQPPTSSSSRSGSNAASPPAPIVDAVLFVVDATALNAGEAGLADGAAFLHDALLGLQRRRERARSSRAGREVPLLVAAAKDDLFTAVPAGLARKALEREVGRVRAARARGLLDVDEADAGQPDEVGLGGYAGGEDGDGAAFEFGVMQEYGVRVEVLGGNVREGPKGVEKWWRWVGECL